MEYSFYEDGRNRFLRLKAEPSEEEAFEARMIMNNQPEGLLRMHPVENETGVFYDYNVSGLVSLKDCESEALLGNYLRCIIFRMEVLADILYEYMLSPSRVRLEETMIFLRRETGQVFFVYDPSKKEILRESLERMMEYFLKRLNPVEEKEVLLLYGLYAKSREPHVAMGTLAEYWRESVGSEQEITEEPQVKPASDDDLRIYEELGLESPEGRMKEKPEDGKGNRGRRRLAEPEKEVDETVEEPMEVMSYSDTLLLTSETNGEGVVRHLGKLLKTYAFEIVVGIIVLGGTIAILLR